MGILSDSSTSVLQSLSLWMSFRTLVFISFRDILLSLSSPYHSSTRQMLTSAEPISPTLSGTMSVSEFEHVPFSSPVLSIPPTHLKHLSPQKKTLVLGFILTSILFERIAYYSLVANLAATLEPSKGLGWSSRHSAVSFLSIGFVLYITGFVSITLILRKNPFFGPVDTHHHSSASWHTEACAPGLFIILVIA
jgi:hypothetical protein